MQNQTSVSVNWSWISQAWKLYTDNTGVWIIMMIIYFVLSIGLNMLFSAAAMAVMFTTIGDPSSGDYDPTRSMIMAQSINLLSMVVSIPFTAFFFTGFFKAAIKQSLGGQITVGDLFSGGDRFLAVLRFLIIVYVLMAVIAMIIIVPIALLGTNFQILFRPDSTPSPQEAAAALGTVFLPLVIVLVVTIFLFSGMFYSIPGIVNNGWGAIEAIKNSFRLVGSKIFIYFLFTLVIALLASSGVFLCFIGLLITLPFYFTVPAVAYREVVGGEIETMPLPPPPPDHWMNNQQ